MDAGECLYKYFDEWLECKEREGQAQSIYGTTGLIAVISYIDYIKEKVDASRNSNRECDQRTQPYYRKSGIE
jgi:hypothetical protein